MTDHTTLDTSLKIVRELSAPIEEVYAAFADPSRMKEWMGPGEVSCKNVEIDLQNQVIKSEHFDDIKFDIRPDIKQRLLSGLDFIGVTETLNGKIDAFEQQLTSQRAWQ